MLGDESCSKPVSKVNLMLYRPRQVRTTGTGSMRHPATCGTSFELRARLRQHGPWARPDLEAPNCEDHPTPNTPTWRQSAGPIQPEPARMTCESQHGITKWGSGLFWLLADIRCVSCALCVMRCVAAAGSWELGVALQSAVGSGEWWDVGRGTRS
jgi:hypothetical protein